MLPIETDRDPEKERSTLHGVRVRPAARSRHNEVRAERTEVAVAHAKDKGEKHNKKTAQKSIKEKRAQKKAKKQAAPRPE